jgi:hypothetical protein
MGGSLRIGGVIRIEGFEKVIRLSGYQEVDTRKLGQQVKSKGKAFFLYLKSWYTNILHPDILVS